MFDKIALHTKSTEYVPYEKTVHEYRAPTDDSIRLYGEILDKAYQSILDKLEVNDNAFNVKAILYHDVLNLKNICKYQLTLNGKLIEGEFETQEMSFENREVFYREMVKKASTHITLEILKQVMKP